MSFSRVPLATGRMDAMSLGVNRTIRHRVSTAVRTGKSLMLHTRTVKSITSLVNNVIGSVFIGRKRLIRGKRIITAIRGASIMDLRHRCCSTTGRYRLTGTSLRHRLLLDGRKTNIGHALRRAGGSCRITRTGLLNVNERLDRVNVSASTMSGNGFAATFPLRTPVSNVIDRVATDLKDCTSVRAPLVGVEGARTIRYSLGIFRGSLTGIGINGQIAVGLAGRPNMGLSKAICNVGRCFGSGSGTITIRMGLSTMDIGDCLRSSSNGDRNKGLFTNVCMDKGVTANDRRYLTLPSRTVIDTSKGRCIFTLGKTPDGNDCDFSHRRIAANTSSKGCARIGLYSRLLGNGSKTTNGGVMATGTCCLTSLANRRNRRTRWTLVIFGRSFLSWDLYFEGLLLVPFTAG